MTADDLKWLVGTALAGLVSIIGVFRSLAPRIANAEEPLHERINSVRDEHVKKSGLLEHMQRYDRSIRELRQEMRTDTKAIQSRLDTLLARGQRPGSRWRQGLSDFSRKRPGRTHVKMPSY